jgi:cytochrome c
VASLEVDKKSGALPLSVSFDASRSMDPDGEKISFDLAIGEIVMKSDDGKFTFEFKESGVYRPVLKVRDGAGNVSTTETAIIAGNSTPEINISVKGNETYYFKGKTAEYKVSVIDKEDGSTDSGSISAGAVRVTVDFMEQGYDKTMVAQGHQKPNHPGQLLIAESDCKSCHLTNDKSAGPAYREIAKKYKGDAGAIEMLANKIIKGGSGVWGDVAMAAHPQITKENAAQMASYILSLSDEVSKSLALSDKIKFDKSSNIPFNTKSAYLISATYEDRGNGALPSLTRTSTRALRAPYLTADDDLILNGPRVEAIPTGSGKALMNVTSGSSVTFKNIDLRGISAIDFSVVEVAGMTIGGAMEVLLGGPEGVSAGTVNFTASPGIKVQDGVFMKMGGVKIPVQDKSSDITLKFTNPKAPDGKPLFIWISGELK